MKSYNEMLDELYKNMPEKATIKERFVPPNFESFIQGNQTIIKNFNIVCEKLRRDPQHLIKYLSKEFAVPGNFDGKRAILQGKFRTEQLDARLTSYISEYILCNECKKPDTDMVMFEGHKYKMCQVCGARSPVKSI